MLNSDFIVYLVELMNHYDELCKMYEESYEEATDEEEKDIEHHKYIRAAAERRICRKILKEYVDMN